LDGGYYTRTQENRPLISKTKVDGSFIIGAVSGYGIMSACAAGELITSHITGNSLPDYAAAFQLDRYDDPHYVESLKQNADGGQL
jgi:glycine/D-amino acid oxidase-like deaminating enzyme